MPRFDHMKGEISVRNLVWRQRGEQFRPGGEEGTQPIPLALLSNAQEATQHFNAPARGHTRAVVRKLSHHACAGIKPEVSARKACAPAL